MSDSTGPPPPQYIVTTPSEVDTEEDEKSLDEPTTPTPTPAPRAIATDAMASIMQSTRKSTSTSSTSTSTSTSTTNKVISHQSIQKQTTKKTSKITSMAATTSQSIEAMLTESAAMAEQHHMAASGSSSIKSHIGQEESESQQLQQFTQKNITSAVSHRSQTLKTASKSEEHCGTMINVSHAALGASSAQLEQQLKAHSSASIGNGGNSHIMQKISLVSQQQQQQQQNTKSKFQSFLQHPEAGGHLSSSGNYLTAHQKHVRQFVRSTSAHSEAVAVGGTTREQKCTRSASTQHEDSENLHLLENISGSNNKLGLQQTSSSVLLSKSAETIEMKTTSSSGMRTQLTLSGGFLAPPMRKLTILSPIHGPPGLHDMLRKSGRSPLSPRISFPGSEADLFG